MSVCMCVRFMCLFAVLLWRVWFLICHWHRAINRRLQCLHCRRSKKKNKFKSCLCVCVRTNVDTNYIVFFLCVCFASITWLAINRTMFDRIPYGFDLICVQRTGFRLSTRLILFLIFFFFSFALFCCDSVLFLFLILLPTLTEKAGLKLNWLYDCIVTHLTITCCVWMVFQIYFNWHLVE